MKRFRQKLIVSDTLYRQKYIFLSAKVINNSVNRRDNYLTINIGKNQGAIKDMGVFNNEGLVGVVKRCECKFFFVYELSS